MALIAIEEHWTSPELTAAVAHLPADRGDDSLALNDRGDTLAHLHDLGAGRIASMDAIGIDLAVLSLSPPGTQPLDPAVAVELSKRANDTAADAVARRPDRLRAMATLPTPDPAAAVAELERAAGLGLVRAMVYGRTGAVPLDDPRYEDLWATAARLHLPVFLHPQIPTPATRQAYRGFDPLTELGLATFGWGWHLDAALAALRLIVRGVFDRHPGLRLILGHWGELLPFWSERTDALARTANLDRPVADYLRTNVYLTASGMLSVPLLRHAVAVAGTDRLLFSTDHPFQAVTRPAVEAFLTELDDDTRTAFTGGTARALFSLPG